MMSNEKEIEISKSFEEKMKDRVREGVGDLITDEDLRPLIIAGIQEVFTKREYVKSTGYGNTGTYKDSVIETVVKENSALREIVTEEVKNWLSENQEIVKNTLDTYIKDNVVNTFNAVLNDMVQGTFLNFKMGLQSDLQQNFGNMFDGQVQQY